MISHEKFSVLVKERFGLFLCLLLGPGRGPRGSPAEHERLADAVALSGELEQASVVHDPVDDRGSELVVREDRAPFAGLDVRGGHDAPPLVTARDDLVEQTGPVDVERHVAELVQDDQVGPAEVPEHRVEVPVAFGLAELEHEFRGLVEPHAQSPFHGPHAQPDREVGLAPAGLAVEHQALRAGHEVQVQQPVERVSVREPHVREVVDVQALDDGEPGAAQEPLSLRAFPVGQFRVEQPGHRLGLPRRGPSGEIVHRRFGYEQSPRLRVEPLVFPRGHHCAPSASVVVNAMSYSLRSGLSSSYSTRSTPSASLAARSVTPALPTPPVDSSVASIASTAFAQPDSLSTRLRVCRAPRRSLSSCRSSHSRNGSGSMSRTRLLRHAFGLLQSIASCMDGSSLLVLAWPYALGCAASRVPPRVGGLYLEGAQADEHVAARVRPVRGVAVPAVERDHAVLVGPHALPRDHVETFPGQGKQGPAVLREQDGLLLVLGVVGFPAELQAPVGQPGVEVLQAPHARFGHEQLAADHADLRLDRALLVARVRRAQGAVEPIMRLERLEQAGPADTAAGSASHARGVVEHDAFGHAAEPFEQVLQRLARAFRVLAGHELGQADVRVREVQHEVSHALGRAPMKHVDLAEIGRGLARMPHQVHERAARLHGRLAPEPGHGPGHGRQRHFGAVLVAQTFPYPGRGVPLFAPAGAVLREPLPDQGKVRVDYRPARPPDGRFLGQVVHPEVLSHSGLAHVLPARYRRYGFAVPSHTTDRLYLGHAGHLPFRSLLVEI